MNDQRNNEQGSGVQDQAIREALDPALSGLRCQRFWVTEFILTYDGKPSYTVSMMEFKGDRVTRETQYFADPFVAPASRAQSVERMDN